MVIEPLGSNMTIQAQTVVKPAEAKTTVVNKEVSTPAQEAYIDPVTASVAKPENSNENNANAGTSSEEQRQAANEKVKKAVEQLNKVIQSVVSDKKTIYDVARESLRLAGTYIGFSNTLSDGLATTLEWAGTDFEASIPEYMRAVVFDRKLKKK